MSVLFISILFRSKPDNKDPAFNTILIIVQDAGEQHPPRNDSM